MSSTTTHWIIKLSPVSQSQMKDMGVSVFESIPINQNIASGVNRESMLGICHIQLRNGGLLSSATVVNC